MSSLDALDGSRMTPGEIDSLLYDAGFGVLSMARDGTPYGIPLSFGFDGDDRLYFLFVGHSEAGRKATYAADTDRVSFLAYEVAGVDDWRSVIVEGPLDRVTSDGWDAAREAMADNAWHPRHFSDADLQQDPRVWVLEIDERTGRKMAGE